MRFRQHLKNQITKFFTLIVQLRGDATRRGCVIFLHPFPFARTMKFFVLPAADCRTDFNAPRRNQYPLRIINDKIHVPYKPRLCNLSNNKITKNEKKN